MGGKYIVLIIYLVICFLYYIKDLSGIGYVSLGGIYWVFKNNPFLGEYKELDSALFLFSGLVVLIVCLALVRIFIRLKSLSSIKKEGGSLEEEYLVKYVSYVDDSKYELIALVLLVIVLFL